MRTVRKGSRGGGSRIVRAGRSAGTRKVILKLQDISKSFGSVVALDGVSFEIYENEKIALVGDNGAGKSTLIKIISGNFPPDRGMICLDGRKVSFRSPVDARKAGIETVYQDLSVCNNLNSIANLFIGRELIRRILGLPVLRSREMEATTNAVLRKVGISMPSSRDRMEYLSGGQRQAVALGRFVAWGKRLVLLDEPTAALGVRETRQVLTLIEATAREKTSILLISHNLLQVFEVVDRIVVLRHGRVVGVREKKKTTPDEIVSMITGAIFIRNKERGSSRGA
jgi:D-xylose transport system ATP-binding protein